MPTFTEEKPVVQSPVKKVPDRRRIHSAAEIDYLIEQMRHDYRLADCECNIDCWPCDVIAPQGIDNIAQLHDRSHGPGP